MQHFFRLFTLVSIALMGLTSCADRDAEAKNMEQIYNENGVPVSVREISLTPFTIERVYDAVLNGYEESCGYAAIADKVEKILYKIGDQVEKDAVVVQFPSDNPSAQYQQAEAAYKNAEAFYRRMEKMFEAGGISQQDLDNARTQYEVALASWDASKQSISVRAPIGGIITSIDVEETNDVNPGDRLFTVARINKMKAEIWIQEEHIGEFRPGLPASAQWHGVNVTGSVKRVDMAMDNERKAFRGVIAFDNPGLKLSSGVMAEITVETYQDDSAIIVDRKDIITNGADTYIFVAQGGKAVKRQVKTGMEKGLTVEVVSGIQPGEMLITEGLQLLGDGRKIKIIEE